MGLSSRVSLQSSKGEEGKILRERQQMKEETIRSDQVTGVLTLQRMSPRPDDSQAVLLILTAAQGVIEC